ncbi:MAG: hypothetical protein NVSMB24_11240 [Mucilaginibacter sp.]
MDDLKFLNRPWEPADFELAKLMSAYWANFIKTGNPNGNGLALWPAYDQTAKQAMIFNKSSRKGELPDWEELQFMESKAGR